MDIEVILPALQAVGFPVWAIVLLMGIGWIVKAINAFSAAISSVVDKNTAEQTKMRENIQEIMKHQLEHAIMTKTCLESIERKLDTIQTECRVRNEPHKRSG